MKTLIKSNNVVTISFAKNQLQQEGIECFVMDVNASIIEGSIGIIPRRLMVIDEDFQKATDVLNDAGLGEDLCQD